MHVDAARAVPERKHRVLCVVVGLGSRCLLYAAPGRFCVRSTVVVLWSLFPALSIDRYLAAMTLARRTCASRARIREIYRRASVTCAATVDTGHSSPPLSLYFTSMYTEISGARAAPAS